MSKPIRTALVALLVATGTLAPGARADTANVMAEGSPEAQAKSRELFRKGSKAYEQGRKQEAYEAFAAAWRLQKSFDVAGNLANVELEIDPPRPRDAAEHLTFAIAHLPPMAGEKQRRGLEGLLAKVRRDIGSVRVKTNVEAEIFVDGASVGRSGGDEIFVEPGTRAIEARAKGYVSTKETVQAAKGASQNVSLTLLPEAAPLFPSASASSSAPPPPPPRSAVPAVVLGGAGAAGLGVGVALLAAAGSQGSEAQKLAQQVRTRGGSCAHPSAALVSTCRDFDNAASSHNTLGVVGGVALAAGGAALGGMVLYLVWPRTPTVSSPSSGEFRVVPVLSSEGGAVGISGRL